QSRDIIVRKGESKSSNRDEPTDRGTAGPGGRIEKHLDFLFRASMIRISPQCGGRVKKSKRNIRLWSGPPPPREPGALIGSRLLFRSFCCLLVCLVSQLVYCDQCFIPGSSPLPSSLSEQNYDNSSLLYMKSSVVSGYQGLKILNTRILLKMSWASLASI
ncbi:hypothetical protein Celaphus_00012746, partial [Cervus elaphus hippelaphus]